MCEIKNKATRLDIITTALPSLIEKNRAILRNVPPFFILCIAIFSTVYDVGLSKEVFQGKVPYISGWIDFGSAKSSFIVIGSLVLWILFVRFGVLYYQVIEITNLVIDELDALKKEGYVGHYRIYNHIISSNYLIVLYLSLIANRGDSSHLKQWVAILTLVMFLLFIAIGQHLTLVAAAPFGHVASWSFFILYFAYYLLFGIKTLYLYNSSKSSIERTLYNKAALAIFMAAMCASTIFNAFTIYKHLNPVLHTFECNRSIENILSMEVEIATFCP